MKTKRNIIYAKLIVIYDIIFARKDTRDHRMHAQVKGPHFGLVRESLAFTSRRSIKPQGPSLGSLRFYAGIRRTTYETTPSAEPIGITPHAAVRNPRNSSKIADKPQWVQLREKDVLVRSIFQFYICRYS